MTFAPPEPFDPPPAETRLWCFAARRGNEVICEGVAAALGLAPAFRPMRPRPVFAAMAPWGPVDPKDRPAPPWPDICFGSGRIAAPYLRHVKRASGGRTFAVFLQSPGGGRSDFDLVWAPAHDMISGPNVVTTVLSPHPITQARLAAARAAPNPALAALAAPRAAFVLGGDSRRHRFTGADIEALARAARGALAQGWSVMATASRRTPAALVEALGRELASAGPGRAVFDAGDGATPYADILAMADAVLVTADSVNMMGEAAATGAPVHVYEPSGRSRKTTALLDALVAQGSARRWRGTFEDFRPEPADATAQIAAAVARGYRAHRERLGVDSSA
jgi:mitochondrial fission protein ELM1